MANTCTALLSPRDVSRQRIAEHFIAELAKRPYTTYSQIGEAWYTRRAMSREQVAAQQDARYMMAGAL